MNRRVGQHLIVVEQIRGVFADQAVIELNRCSIEQRNNGFLAFLLAS
jgi:hypothetical protein